MIAAQGGDLDASRPVAPASDVPAPRAGYIERIDTECLGRAIITLGGGRAKLGDALDHSVGLEMLVRVGEKVESGQPIVKLFAPKEKADAARQLITDAISIGDTEPGEQSLIFDRVD
jgi:thymidine phosphorylase